MMFHLNVNSRTLMKWSHEVWGSKSLLQWTIGSHWRARLHSSPSPSHTHSPPSRSFLTVIGVSNPTVSSYWLRAAHWEIAEVSLLNNEMSRRGAGKRGGKKWEICPNPTLDILPNCSLRLGLVLSLLLLLFFLENSFY